MIEVKNVKKFFKEITLFKDISLDIEENQKMLIKGVNGSGKSVFLKMIVGYSEPNSGTITIEGFQLHEDGDFIPNAGVSINAPEFVKSITGLENLLELAKIRKIATKEDIVALAKKMSLEKDLGKKYKTYSLGMRQKMRLIQALMDKPKYLILDEPFDALDQQSCKQVKALLNEHIEVPGNVLIFTSHSAEFEEFASTVYEIDDKNLVKIR